MKRYKVTKLNAAFVTFKYAVYERTWYWPFWSLLLNTTSLAEAEEVIKRDKWVKYYD